MTDLEKTLIPTLGAIHRDLAGVDGLCARLIRLSRKVTALNRKLDSMNGRMIKSLGLSARQISIIHECQGRSKALR